jgi:very-short-patch-repair endonuclease
VYRRAVRRALDLHLISSADLKREELTRSELERIFRTFCRRHRLPQPEVNARHHADRAAFESDRARDAHLQSLGFRVLRFTHRQLMQERSAVVAALRPLLGQSPLAPNL